ncbi:MAG: hypothetical protein JWN30_767, partial [Bacilli bacterium]|nr:hypothetical protein [Bacilli bacterium]
MVLVSPSLTDLVTLLDTLIPPALAMEGDPIGLQLGDPARPVRSVLLALDASHSRVIEEAITKKVDLVISHHALIYRPLKKLLTTDVYQKGIQQLIRHDIAVFAAHTNWDIAVGGVNDRLAKLL